MRSMEQECYGADYCKTSVSITNGPRNKFHTKLGPMTSCSLKDIIVFEPPIKIQMNVSQNCSNNRPGWDINRPCNQYTIRGDKSSGGRAASFRKRKATVNRRRRRVPAYMVYSFLRPRSTAVGPCEMKNTILIERAHFSKGVFSIVYESSFDITQSSFGYRGGAFGGVRGNESGLCLRDGRSSKAIKRKKLPFSSIPQSVSGIDSSIEMIPLPTADTDKEESEYREEAIRYLQMKPENEPRPIFASLLSTFGYVGASFVIQVAGWHLLGSGQRFIGAFLLFISAAAAFLGTCSLLFGLDPWSLLLKP